MAKFSNKPGGRPTKRKTLKQKYKIERKIKAFHKRSRRTARKLRATGAKKGGKRQMPLPNMFPFKTDVIEETKRERDYVNSLKKSKKNTKNVEMQPENEVTLANNKKQFTNIENFISKCDAVIEVLDARDPAACRNVQFEKTVIQQGKKLILLLNKADLVPDETAVGWQKLLNETHPTVLYSCTGSVANSKSKLQCTAVGHGYLFHIIKSLTALEKSVIGVAGASGVGRTSLLESFAKIGRTTGVSIEQEEPVLIEVNKNISVLDTIGELELTTSPLVLKGKEKGSHSGALVEQIIKSASHDALLEIYRIPQFDGLQDFLLKVAKATGQLQKGGVPDIKKATNLVCEDWTKYRIPFCTAVPNKTR